MQWKCGEGKWIDLPNENVMIEQDVLEIQGLDCKMMDIRCIMKDKDDEQKLISHIVKNVDIVGKLLNIMVAQKNYCSNNRFFCFQ